MLSTEECIAKAAALSRLADEAPAAELRDAVLVMAATWVELSLMAERQDADPLSSTYRIR